MNKLDTIDYIVFFVYFIIVSGYGIWIYRRKTGHDGTLEGDSKDYFLAEGSLTWWAIGSPLIASNAAGVYEIPFLDRMGFVFLISVAAMVVISLYQTSRGVKTNGLEVDRSMFKTVLAGFVAFRAAALEVDRSMFKTTRSFAIGSMVIMVILTTLYTVYW